MIWRPWKKRPDVLELIATRMSQFHNTTWQAADGIVKGPGSTAIVQLPSHSDVTGHLDLAFVLNVDRPEETSIVDCIQGYGVTKLAAQRHAIDTWATVTASTVIEMLEPANEYATHLPGNDPDGYPGWHAIYGPIVGWGRTDADLLVRWVAETNPAAQLTAALKPSLREHFNGVKMILGGTAGQEICEVRVNGEVNETASRTLLEMPWPRLPKPAFARTFLLLAHEEEESCLSEVVS